jgi:hypothetical protein
MCARTLYVYMYMCMCVCACSLLYALVNVLTMHIWIAKVQKVQKQ